MGHGGGHFLEQLEPACAETALVGGKSGGVATGMSEARHQAGGDWITERREQNRDGAGLAHERHESGPAISENQIRIHPNKFCRFRANAIGPAVTPSHCGSKRASFGPPRALKALTKYGYITATIGFAPIVQDGEALDHAHLFRACRKRPRCEKRDEAAPFQLIEFHQSRRHSEGSQHTRER